MIAKRFGMIIFLILLVILTGTVGEDVITEFLRSNEPFVLIEINQLKKICS